MTEDFEDVCASIKACLNSAKNQISMHNLDRDYESLLGMRIPYQAFNYQSLEDFLRNVPDLIITRSGRDIFIDVKVDEKTAHIARLVRGQKSSKKKPSNSYRGFGYRRAPPPRRFSPPKSYYRPNNPRYGSQTAAPKHYEPPRSNPGVNYNANPKPLLSTDTKAGAPRDIRPSSYKHPDDPRSNVPRYNSESQNKAPKYYQVPQYNSEINSTGYNNKKDYNHNNHSTHNTDNSKLRNKSNSPQFSPTFSDSEEDSLSTVTVNGHTKTKANIENLQVTSGNRRKVTVGKHNSRLANNMKKHNFIDEDFHSSMNDIQNSDLAKLSDTDFIVSSTRKMSLKYTPAALVAAGKAQIEPKRTAPNIELMDTSPIHLSPASSVMDEIYSQPFKMMNKSASAHVSELLIDVNSKPKTFSQFSPHSSLMYNKMSPPAMNIPNPKLSPQSTPNPIIIAAKPSSMKMSDPFMFTPGPHIAPDCTEGSACGQLIKYARMRNLPVPVFKNYNKPDPRTGVKYFLSRVNIGDNYFNSFQLETSNLKDAQEYVAKVALEELRRRLDSVDSAVLPYTNNQNTIIDRVAEIVNPHSAGLKATYVESQYKALHKEILPFNWIEIIENMSLLSVEKLVGELYIYRASDENSNAAMVTQLPELVLPLSNTWNVFITVVSSPNRIYFRIIHDDYDGRFAKMSENMDAIYSSEETKKKPVEIVREGNFYAALIESNWFRVKAMGLVADEKVDVMLIDVGDVDKISKDSIYHLDEEMTKIPAQAVRCGLTNLEEYCNNAYITELIDEFISERTLVAKVDSRNPRLQLTLHDTCTDEDINVNELILQKIKHELTPPKIPAPLSNRSSVEKVKPKEMKSSDKRTTSQRSTSGPNLSGMLMDYWESELAVKKEKREATKCRMPLKTITWDEAQRRARLKMLAAKDVVPVATSNVGAVKNSQISSTVPEKSKCIMKNGRDQEQRNRRITDLAAATPTTPSISTEKSVETEKEHSRSSQKGSQLPNLDPVRTLSQINHDLVTHLKTNPAEASRAVHITVGSEVSFIGELAASRMSHNVELTVLKPPRKCRISLDGEYFPIHDIKYSMCVTFFVGQLSFKENLHVVSRIQAPQYPLNRIHLGRQFVERVVQLIDPKSSKMWLKVGDQEEVMRYELQRAPKYPAKHTMPGIAFCGPVL